MREQILHFAAAHGAIRFVQNDKKNVGSDRTWGEKR